MRRTKPWIVTEVDIRTFPHHGTKCLYCPSLLGKEHAQDCVVRNRTVIVRAVIEYIVKVPEAWSAHDIEFHRNESSWCADNGINEIYALTVKDCWCRNIRYSYLREATAEDEEAFGLSIEDQDSYYI